MEIFGIIDDILGKLLNTSNWPEALVAITAITAGAWVLRAFLLKR